MPGKRREKRRKGSGGAGRCRSERRREPDRFGGTAGERDGKTDGGISQLAAESCI